MEEIKAGIDLGTTNSAVAVIGDDGKPFIVVNGDGNRITPSVVGADSGNLVVGDNAKDLQSIGCIDTAAFFKRHMGDANFRVQLDGETYDAAGLSALLPGGTLHIALGDDGNVTMTGPADQVFSGSIEMRI